MAQYSSKEMELWGKWSLHREKGGKKEFMCEKKRETEKERDRERKIKLWREGSHRKQGEGKNCCVRESEKRQRERAKS